MAQFRVEDLEFSGCSAWRWPGKTHKLPQTSLQLPCPIRLVITPQRSLDEIDIAAVQLDPRSRDDIAQLLRGLQHIYTEPALRERVFAILREILPKHANGLDLVDATVGRPGMLQWRILVLGVMRLGLNADYDRVQDLANNHRTMRQMLGHGEWTSAFEYKTQTLKDNLQLFTPEILERINQEVVNAGHVLLKKKADEPLAARCDSFVVKTHVHCPTDINLLWDAVRKSIEICAQLCQSCALSDWRQSEFNLRRFKKLYRTAQQLKRCTAQDTAKRQAQRRGANPPGRARVCTTAPPAQRGRIGDQRAGATWPGHVPRSRDPRLQALRGAGGGGPQCATPGHGAARTRTTRSAKSGCALATTPSQKSGLSLH
jgi:hypothetical protein